MSSSGSTTSSTLPVRVSNTPLDRAALCEVARLHQLALPQAFLSSLGVGLLTEFYAGIQRYQGGTLLTARAEDGTCKIVGFVSGVDDIAVFHRWLTRKHFPRAAFRLLPSLAMHACLPSMWRKLAELLFYPRKAKKLDVELPAAELLSLGVAESHRRHGIARELYVQLMNHFQQQHVPAFRILVGGQLPEAPAFYQAQGALEVARFELHAGGQTLVFVQEVPTTKS
jgi:ribosomal protein S18 acetylase RimI-like enzyme